MIRYGILLSAAIVVLGASASAEANDSLSFAIGRCSAEQDAKARLACYDELASKLKTGAVAPAATPPVAQSAPPVAQATPSAPQKQGGSWYDPTSWFGKEAPERASNNPADFGGEVVRKPATEQAESEPLQQISAHVVSVNLNAFGHFTVTLDNGQVWRQLQGDSGVARFSRNGGDTVTISRGFFGSYNLTIEGKASLFKVTRVQ